MDTIGLILEQCNGRSIKEVYPVNYNELFLYPRALEFLKLIREKLPKTRIVLFTNASVLNKKIIDEIISLNLIDSLNFSLDAFAKDTYEKMRGLNYDKVLKNINYFISKNKTAGNKIKLGVTFTVTDLNENETKKFKNYWEKRGLNVQFSVDDGRKNGNPYIIRRTNLPCSAAINSMTILCNGDVVPCCMDPFGTMIMGNIYNTKIEEIWKNEKYMKFRKMHFNGERSKIPLCKNCPMI